MQFETIYFVERKSKSNILSGDILEWTISLSNEKTYAMKEELEKSVEKNDTYYVVRSMIITS